MTFFLDQGKNRLDPETAETERTLYGFSDCIICNETTKVIYNNGIGD